MPINYADYHPDWKAISKRIRFERAGGKCEWCGVEHGAIGARDLAGNWFNQEDWLGWNSEYGYSVFGTYAPRIIKIVLTVAHLDHDKNNNDDDNLAALCQRCHLNYDRPRHLAKRKLTMARLRKERLDTAERNYEAESGQLRMFKDA